MKKLITCMVVMAVFGFAVSSADITGIQALDRPTGDPLLAACPINSGISTSWWGRGVKSTNLVTQEVTQSWTVGGSDVTVNTLYFGYERHSAFAGEFVRLKIIELDHPTLTPPRDHVSSVLMDDEMDLSGLSEPASGDFRVTFDDLTLTAGNYYAFWLPVREENAIDGSTVYAPFNTREHNTPGDRLAGGKYYEFNTGYNREAGTTFGITYEEPPVPEPGSFALLALGLGGIVGRKRRK